MKKSTVMKNKRLSNVNIVLTLALIVAMLAVVISGCSSNAETSRSQETGNYTETGEGHGAESGESGGEDSGESGDPSSPILTLDESWDGVVNGIRTAMSYDSARGSFSGIVENTTNKTLRSILIELNLKQGTKTVVELGPQPVGDLAPGEKAAVKLLVSDEPLAKGVKFDAWQIHPEAEGIGNEGREGSEGANGLALNETYDVTKKGARMVISYDKKSNSFKGFVENTINKTLTRARVEVHLSNGAELGPTTPVDIAPGKKINITLKATSKSFDSWTTHAEFGGSEHGAGGGSEEKEGSGDRENRENGGEHANSRD